MEDNIKAALIFVDDNMISLMFNIKFMYFLISSILAVISSYSTFYIIKNWIIG